MNAISGAAVKVGMPQGRRACATAAAEPVIDRGEVVARLPEGQISTAPAIDELCAALVNLQRNRVFCIKQQSVLDRSIEAYIRLDLGYDTSQPKPERERISKMAKAIIKKVESGDTTELDENIVLVIIGAHEISKRWDDRRNAIEKEMIALASQLPAIDFVRSVRGVSAKGLAIIVGEAGNLALYPTRSHLQKRLGIACIDGQRQGNPGNGATAEDWTNHGYNPHRRAQVWAICDDVMLRAQWRKEQDGVPGHPIGPYGEHYARKKAEYVVRAHPAPDRAARRYMAKMFIRDLWKAWNAAVVDSVP